MLTTWWRPGDETLLLTPTRKWAAAGNWAAAVSPRLDEAARMKAGQVMAMATTRRVRAGAMDRFIDTIEWLAAAFVGIVAADIFISVLLRYFSASRSPTVTISASCCSAS